MNASPVRILLVDDHAVARAELRALFGQQTDFRVVGETGDVASAFALCLALQPHVIVMDLFMPGSGGLEFIQQIAGRFPEVRILVYTAEEHAELAERVVQLGARGYLTRKNSPEALPAAISQVAAGDIALSPDVAHAIAVRRLCEAANPLQSLSTREVEVFRLLAAGHSAAHIAKQLRLSTKTVANNRALIKQKLGLATDVDLVLFAQRMDIH
jgi:two-component system, NarL family, invasion response regulator UvrY